MKTRSTGPKAKFKRKPGRSLKERISRTATTLLLLFGIFSLLPYYIPATSLKQDPRELAFEQSSFAEINGVNLHLRVWDSPGSGSENILLVHGYWGSTFSWRHTAPALNEAGYQVMAVDLPGFGLSERRPGLDHSQAGRANLLWVLLDQVLPGENWHLVGHSIGGGTVAEMALQQPERVNTITFVDADIYSSPSRKAKFIYSYPPIRQWIKILGPRFFFKGEQLKSIITSAYGREPDEEELQGYRLPLSIAGSDDVLKDLVGLGYGTVGPVSSLNIPSLCIWGEKDTWAPLTGGGDLCARLFRGKLIVLTDQHHCPMETAPGEFNRILLEFLKSRS